MNKKLWGFAALPLLAVLATSCTKESVESKSDRNKVITFKTAVGKQTLTRASEIDLISLQAAAVTAPIEVEAYIDGVNTGSPYYKHFNLKYNTGTEKWSYNDGVDEYHPAFDLRYYSVVPTPSLWKGGDGTDASFDYTIEEDPADQVDLIAAMTTTTNDNAGTATARLTYNHLLSQVNFAVVGLEGIYITVDNIELSGLRNTGTYSFKNGWSVEATSTGTYTYLPAPSNTTDGTDDVLYLGNTGDIDTPNNEKSNALMLMPQSLANSGSFSFSYTLKNRDGGLLNQGEATVAFSGLGEGKWLPGRRYLYKIVFEAPVLIRFEVDVTSWKDEPANDVE